MSTCHCRLCGCEGYTEIEEWTGEEHIIVGYKCNGCSVMFADPGEFFVQSDSAEKSEQVLNEVALFDGCGTYVVMTQPDGSDLEQDLRDCHIAHSLIGSLATFEGLLAWLETKRGYMRQYAERNQT